MFAHAATAPADGRPVLWLPPDGCSACIMFVHVGFWWELDLDDDRLAIPYATVEDMKSTGWVWADLPHAQLAACMRNVNVHKDWIDENYSN